MFNQFIVNLEWATMRVFCLCSRQLIISVNKNKMHMDNQLLFHLLYKNSINQIVGLPSDINNN